MRKTMIAAAALAGVLGLTACNNAADETTADGAAMSADDTATNASDATGSSAGAGEAASATDSASDASAPGGMSGDTVSPPAPVSPTSTVATDPMVTGQGSMREDNPNRGNIDMPSEPSHPARQ